MATTRTVLLCCAFFLGAPPSASSSAGYLIDARHGEVTAYVPAEGDLVFYYDHTVFWRTLFWLAGAAPPDHVGIVVRLPDRSLALLEAGPDERPRVEFLQLPDHLFYYQGTVWVRRLRSPLSPAQSNQLWNFAVGEIGKPYALHRVALMITPFSPRDPVISRLFGRTHGERSSWFCSELVAEAGIRLGFISPTQVHPNITLPQDLFTDQEIDLSKTWAKPLVWSPTLDTPRLSDGRAYDPMREKERH